MDIAGEVFQSLVTQGPLVGFLFYLYYEGRNNNKEQNDKIDNLQKELRENQEKYLNKSYEQQGQTNAVLQGLKETFQAFMNGNKG